MASKHYTDEDRHLADWQPEKIEQLRQNISHGRPYVWELRLSLKDFNELENALSKSIASHSGKYNHLLCEEFALHIIVYIAEWYKRRYNGVDTETNNIVLSLSTEELKNVIELAKIDYNIFVYDASKNPERTSRRWLESMQLLGGLAIEAEINRTEAGSLLTDLCRIFHGEEIDLEELKDRGRAVAFHESIIRKHSLYEYLACIFDKKREMPFAVSDINNPETRISELINIIQNADKEAKRDKFDFEWIVAYTASRNQMMRFMHVSLKPEEIGGGKRQYIGYERLQGWGVEKPDSIGRINFYLRFRNGKDYISKESGKEKPLFVYDNTGYAETGFLSVGNLNDNTYSNIPASQFDCVELVMKYDDAEKSSHERVVQKLAVPDYMQVYFINGTSNRFSSKRNSQALTVVIYSQAYHLAEDCRDLSVANAHFINGENTGEEYSLCSINDKVVLKDSDNKELTFFNRNGRYMVQTRKYLKTIKYQDNIYVLYKYVDLDDDEEEINEDRLPVMFGRGGLDVLYFPNKESKTGEPVTEYELDWKTEYGQRFISWKEKQPEQGKIKIRVSIKDLQFTQYVYYVPFVPQTQDQQPLWRDFERMRICSAIAGTEDLQDDFKKSFDEKQDATIAFEIGTDNAKIYLDVYRPVILRELSQKQKSDSKSRIVGFYDSTENVHIPLINCDQFSLRDFSENGVKEYDIKCRNTIYYNFLTFNDPALSAENYKQEKSAAELTPDIPLEYLKIYISRVIEKKQDLFAWNYKKEPWQVENERELTDNGIVFQSLKDNPSPRHYASPSLVKKGFGLLPAVNALDCFETIAEHNVYFFLFKPLIQIVKNGQEKQIKEIIIPLIKKRNYLLTDRDIDNLYRFAVEFHFDWMLLPRSMWVAEIEAAAQNDNEREALKSAVMSFFAKTPKCIGENEVCALNDFLKIYWDFNDYPKMDPVAETALCMILEKTVIAKYADRRDLLKQYDECRFKFSEMSKAVIIQNE